MLAVWHLFQVIAQICIQLATAQATDNSAVLLNSDALGTLPFPGSDLRLVLNFGEEVATCHCRSPFVDVTDVLGTDLSRGVARGGIEPPTRGFSVQC